MLGVTTITLEEKEIMKSTMNPLPRRIVMFCLVALFWAGCNQQTQDTKADKRAIRAWFDRYVANNNAGDFAAYSEFLD